MARKVKKNPEWLLECILLDGNGSGRNLSMKEFQKWKPADGTIWIHMDLNKEEAANWVRKNSGLDELITEALLEKEEPRARCFPYGKGLMLFLRAINANRGKEPDDMISLRIWGDSHKIITIRETSVLDIQLIKKKIMDGVGPENAGELIDEIVSSLLDRVVDSVDNLEDIVDDLDDKIINKEGDVNDMIARLSETRRQISTIRRYIAPERDALTTLSHQLMPWISQDSRLQYGESSHRLTRIVEDLDSLKERVLINMDEVANLSRDQSRRTTYILTIVATVFIPLTFITGLMGMNVGGIPFGDDPVGFWSTSLIMVGLSILMLVFFKLKKWI